MGQFILFLLGLFAIGCVLYGISAGVQIIQRGFSYLAESARDGASDKKPLITSVAPDASKPADMPAAQRDAVQPETKASTPPAKVSPMQRSIVELREIFALFQQGALTEAEFENMKQCLLSCIKTTGPGGH